MALDVSRSTAQAKARLALFSTPQKVIIALLAVVGLVAVGTFARWVTAPSYGVLMAGLEATDAAAVTAQLDTGGVPYKLEAGGTTVLVPTDQLQAQRLAVAAAGLPQGTTQGYELLDKQGMTSSSFQQQVAYQRAVEGELNKTLAQLGDVRTATVHLSIPEKELYTDRATPARASVLLDTRRPLPRESVEAVQHLVAAAVPDLAPEGVTVSDTKGSLLSTTGPGGSGSEAAKTLEDAATVRADSMLASMLGPGKAVVRVNAEMDTTTTRTSESETYDPTKTVTLRRDASKESYNGSGAFGNGGLISVPDPIAVNGTSTDGNGASTYGKDDTKEEFGVNRQVDKTSVVPGGLKRLTVAVAVDSRGPSPAQQVVSDLVANAVGLDPARGDTISVAFAAFADPGADAAAEAAAAAAGARDYVRLGTVGLAALLLLVIAVALLRALRRGTVSEIPLESLSLPAASPASLSAAQSAALAASSPESTVEDARILELVDSRPDEVSSLIRNWLAEPAGSGK